MTIIRLDDEELIVHSPCEISDLVKDEIDTIGDVKKKGVHHFALTPFCFILKTAVDWCLECVVVCFWQGAMRRNNQLLQRIATQSEIKNSVL